MKASRQLASVASFLLGLLARRGECAVSALADFTAAGGVLAGGIRFDQVNDTEPVRVFVNLYNLVKPPNSWFISALPVMDGDCSATAIGNPFNPTSSKAKYFCPDKKSNADCIAGDMTGKFGHWNGEKATAVFMDDTLKLRGAASILHRAVVLVDADGHPYACATITSATATKVLEAKFGEPQPLQGSIWMNQDTDDPMADTTVVINLAFTDGQQLKGAMYHVHEGSMLEPGANCSTLKSHFNPTMAAPCKADPASWSECELGDISGRHGGMNLPATRDGRLFFTDTFLPLSGPYGMEDRSIVVHDKNGKRLACAALKLGRTPFKQALLSEPKNKDGPLGPEDKYPREDIKPATPPADAAVPAAAAPQAVAPAQVAAPAPNAAANVQPAAPQAAAIDPVAPQAPPAVDAVTPQAPAADPATLQAAANNTVAAATPDPAQLAAQPTVAGPVPLEAPVAVPVKKPAAPQPQPKKHPHKPRALRA